MTAIKTRLSFLVRLALSAALVAFILTRIDMARVGDLLVSVRLEFFVLALFIIFLERVIMAYKWNVLLAAKKMAAPLMRMVKICYVSNFVGAFLPSSLGVDVFRSYSLYRHGTDLSESVSSVVVDKTLALVAAMTVPVTIVIFFPSVVPDSAIRWLVLVVALCLGVFLVVGLNGWLVRSLLGRLSRVVRWGLWSKAERLYNTLYEYTAYRRALAYVFVLSLVFQAFRVAGVYAIGLSLGLDFNILYYFAFVPVIIILTMVPIAVAGIGVREGAFVYLFSQAGMPAADAFTLSVLIYVVSILSVIPGGIFYLLEGASLQKA